MAVRRRARRPARQFDWIFGDCRSQRMPVRRILRIDKIPARSGREDQANAEIHLECGHKTWTYWSTAPQIYTRCHKCWRRCL